MKSLQLLAYSGLLASSLFTPTMSFASLGTGSSLGILTFDQSPSVETNDGSYQEARRGRGRGGDRDRGGRDDSRSDRDDRRDDRSGGRSRPRVPGGSGCDDPGDIREHPECSGGGAVNGTTPSLGGGGHGGRPRIPGGSGCDDPQDIIEHPECRV